jgi:hydrogenase nickel incorporation protein HypA/HybF
MHEVAAMRGAVSAALARMREEGATRVTRVTLVLGVSGHLTEDAARQHFAVLAKGTPAEHAQLDITWLPATYQCFDCLHQFTSIQSPDAVLCPECDGPALEIAHSDNCCASEIEVEGPAEALPPP